MKERIKHFFQNGWKLSLITILIVILTTTIIISIIYGYTNPAIEYKISSQNAGVLCDNEFLTYENIIDVRHDFIGTINYTLREQRTNKLIIAYDVITLDITTGQRSLEQALSLKGFNLEPGLYYLTITTYAENRPWHTSHRVYFEIVECK